MVINRASTDYRTLRQHAFPERRTFYTLGEQAYIQAPAFFGESNAGSNPGSYNCYLETFYYFVLTSWFCERFHRYILVWNYFIHFAMTSLAFWPLDNLAIFVTIVVRSTTSYRCIGAVLPGFVAGRNLKKVGNWTHAFCSVRFRLYQSGCQQSKLHLKELADINNIRQCAFHSPDFKTLGVSGGNIHTKL